MAHHKLSFEEASARNKARWKIIQEANKYKMTHHRHNLNYLPTMYGMKNLNEAVFLCRQKMLVQGRVLMDAGFKAPVLKPGKPSMLRRLLGER